MNCRPLCRLSVTLWLLAIAIGSQSSLRAQPASEFVLEGESGLTPQQVIRFLDRYEISLNPPIDAPTADDAAFYLRESLRIRGYPEASAEYSFVGRTLVFSLEVGRQYHVGEIDFRGGEGLPKERLAAIYQSAMRQSTLTPFGRIEYAERATESASSALESTFRDEGYIAATVVTKPIFQSELVDLEVTVQQGPRAHVQSLTIEGDNIPGDLISELSEQQGEIYFPGEEAVMRSSLLSDLRERGFYDAEVASSATIGEGGQVAITLQATPGRRYRLRRVEVTGNKDSRKAAILGRMGLPRGKPYDVAAVDAAVRRLWFTGAFENIETETTKADDDTLDLIVTVEEGRAKQISATVGYGQWEQGFANITYTDRNFLGTLNRFFVTGLVSTRTYGIVTGISDPWLFRSDATGTLSALYLNRETPAYQSTFYGVNLEVERRFDAPSTTAWRFGYTWRATSDTTVFAEDASERGNPDYRLGELSFGQTLDRRNNPLVPMSGYLLSWDGAIASPALLGDISFGKIEAQATGYLPLRKILPERPFVPFLAFNHRAAWIAPFGNTDGIPVQERFFLGGPDSVRSFLFDGMAPRDQRGTPEGGELSLLANAELQVPLWQAIYGVAFVDVGNLAATPSEFSWDDTRVAFGVGARFYTPLGAVRIDYGANLIRGPGDPIGAWQFGFGFTF